MLGRENIITSVFRSFPDSIKFISLLNYIAHPSNNNLYTFVLFFLSTVINFVFKKIFYGIYKLNKTTKLPVLGLGGRPQGASSCSTFLTFDDKLSKTFGMPSGHSQMAWVFVSYFIFQIWDPLYYRETKEQDNLRFNNDYDENTINAIKIVQTIVLILFAVFMSYSRVYIEKCHTFQQVFIGAIFGTGIGYLAYYLKPYILK